MATANGIIKPVEDGNVADISGTGQGTAATRNKNSLDKDAFLQLLVAQMKYQDPLEPTSNTEYISQLATFSSLEEMQNLNKTMTDMQGTDLVGKQVVLKVTSEITGITTTVSGYVDYVTRENGKTYLVVNGNPYSIDTLESVVDEEYLNAILVADNIKEAVGKLPDRKYLTLENKDALYAIRDTVNKMSAYQQGFLDSNSLNKLRELLEQMAVLEEAAGENKDDGTEGDGAVEGGGDTGEAGDGESTGEGDVVE